MNLGQRVDLYYYGENNSVRSVCGLLINADESWVVIEDIAGDEQYFPHRAIQRIIPRGEAVS